MERVLQAMRDPRWFVAVLWPLVLAVPYLPGIPKPSVGGLAWRQELAFAAILVGTFALILSGLKKAKSSFVQLNFPFSSLLISAVLFAAWSAASAFWAANPYSAAHYAFTWGAFLLFFCLIHLVAAHSRAMRALFYALAGVVWLLSLSCVIEWLFGDFLTDHSYRANLKPLFRGFSGFGETMAVAAPIFAALALSVRKQRTAVLCGATSLVAWLVVLQAFQRAPILGATAAFIALGAGILIFKRCQTRSPQRVALMLAGLIVIAVLQLVVFAATPGEDFTALQRLAAVSPAEDNTKVRLLYWGAGVEMFRAHPLVGVGANNYEVAFSAARQQFAATHPGSSLVGMNEQLLTQYAHNEYVQILAELGIVGILIFAAFCLLLARTIWRAARHSHNPLLALGAGAGLLAFAISSAASAFSFRWFGSGLMCFFAAALVSHLEAGSSPKRQPASDAGLRPAMFQRAVPACAFGFAGVMFIGAGMQAMNGVTHAWAQTSRTPSQAESFYRHSLRFNPFDAASHFDYGSLLYQQRRYDQAVQHLQYAVAHGFNTSTSYAMLAAAEEAAGDAVSSERTLAVAAKAYPRSVFILVRHAAALSRVGESAESEQQFSEALALDARAARGWYQLINFDIDAALSAAQKDSSLAKPGELKPQTAIYVVLKENERRLNIPATSGWRGRVGAFAN
ncbi:MAG: O-antigen ligase family protein [Pyrinomonadaceae bacterium]